VLKGGDHAEKKDKYRDGKVRSKRAKGDQARRKPSDVKLKVGELRAQKTKRKRPKDARKEEKSLAFKEA